NPKVFDQLVSLGSHFLREGEFVSPIGQGEAMVVGAYP
ncbi:efflux RND transporter periplasmic adaptor subunit, partial [Xylella fastidiosa subsp. multiplex]|nr:efflux RND transporter periplasmic adaptor subunit [Xylella fastidiosa subsp. multiplex]